MAEGGSLDHRPVTFTALLLMAIASTMLTILRVKLKHDRPQSVLSKAQ